MLCFSFHSTYFNTAGCIEFDTEYYGYDLLNGKSITTTWQECGKNKYINDQYSFMMVGTLKGTNIAYSIY